MTRLLNRAFRKLDISGQRHLDPQSPTLTAALRGPANRDTEGLVRGSRLVAASCG